MKNESTKQRAGKQTRDKVLVIRVTGVELERWQFHTAKVGIPLAEFIRQAVRKAVADAG